MQEYAKRNRRTMKPPDGTQSRRQAHTQADIASRKGMNSTCIQNIINRGDADKDENTKTGKVTPLVPANYTSHDEFYDSQNENENEHGINELNTKRNGVLLLGRETVRTPGNVELAKQTVQNVVELYLRQEDLQADVALGFTIETEEKLVDLPMSEEHDIYRLSALTEDSSDNARLHPEEPEISEHFELKCVSEEETKRGVHHKQNLAIKTDLILKREELGPKSSKKRRKSASNKGSPSQFVSRSVTSTQPSCENLLKVKDAVERAIREHKTFTVQGTFPTIREAMRHRGWIEKETNRNKATMSLDDASIPSSISVLTSLMKIDRRTSEALLTARLLRNVEVDFLWTMRSEPIDWQAVQKNQIINRFPRAYFTTKVGLCAYLQHTHWFCESDVSHISFPRCYSVCQPDELTAFTHDFRMTACLGLLKWLVRIYENQGETSLKSVEGKIPFTAVEFALKRCQEYISIQAHEDIDRQDSISVWDHQWDQFLTWYYMAVHDNFLLLECRTTSIVDLYESAKHVLTDIRKFWPQIDLDGMNNIWIVKPGAQSRGRGIQLTDKLERVMEKVNPTALKESRFVVQKYIECPLLIYDTKFDIRQWFLVTCAQPLTIWMYKESYLRFCSQPFDLISMHESVHLCNNAVQSKYKNAKRNAGLPDENMWDCYTFQTYLRGIGHADMWEKCIYPGMRQSIICALLASQEHMDRRTNCFELFGADFMLSEDFSPWLIEINSCPCMQATTSVTARMCSQCLEDVIKVVIDKRSDKRASTGMFELIYRQHAPQAPPYLGMNLSIRGTKVRNTVSRPRSQTRSANKANIPRDRSNEQESYSSSPDNSKKRKSVMLQSSFSRRPTVTSSSGSSGDNRCQDCPEKFAIQSIPGISFEGEALFSEQSRQPTSKESIMETHSGDGSDEQNLVSSDSEYTVNPNYSTNNAQLNNLQEYINSEPEYKLDINHSSEQLKFLDTNLETILDKNPDIHSKNSIDVASYDNEGNHKHETGLNSSSAISAEQELPSSPPECVTKNTARLKDYEMNQPIDSSPENKLQVKEAGIKKSEGSSNEVQPVSNGHELNMVKWRSIRVTNFKLARTEHEAVSSGPENSTQKNRTEIIKKTGSTSKEQEPVTSGLEQTVSRKSRLKFRKKNQGGSGTEMTMRKKNNCKVQKMSDSSDDQHSVNSGSFQKKKSTKIKNSSDSSEEQKSRCDYNRDRKKSATIKPMRQRCEGQQLFDSDTENVTQKKTSSGTKDTCDSSDEQELISSGYDNKAHLNYSKIKCLRENSEYQELSTKPESPSQKKRKNLGGNISSDGSGIQEQCKRTKQSLNKSIEEDEVSTFSDIQKKSKETDKSQGSDGESEEVAVHATPKHKKAMPNTMSLYGSSIVDHGKGSQAQKGTHTSLLHGGMTEMQGKDVMDAQECEEIFKNATAVMQGKAECTAAKTAGKSWSHTKEGFSISHFTETIYSNAEEIIPKGKKCYSSGWKNSSDAEKSMEYFNEWRQKLDHTKASCEDMLAKFKTVRDNENIIHTPKYYSIDKGINWEGESANKPTISDIIKKLSQTRPEREFFTCNTGRKFIDIIPEHALSKKKEKIKTHQYDLSMVDEDNMNSTAKTNRRLCSGPSDQRLSLTTHVYHPSVNRNPISIAILPHIRQRIKQPSDNNLFCSGRKVDSFYAVSMNLKTLQASQNIRQHLLLPLGSDQCLGVNSTIPAAIEGSLL